MVDWADLGLGNPYTIGLLEMDLVNLLYKISQLEKKTVHFGWVESDRNIVYNIHCLYKAYLNTRKEVFGKV